MITMGQGTLALDREAGEFRNRYAVQSGPFPGTHFPQVSRQRDFEEAVNNPMGIWPAHQILFIVWKSARLPRNPIPRPTFAGIPSKHGSGRYEDPASMALVVSRA